MANVLKRVPYNVYLDPNYLSTIVLNISSKTETQYYYPEIENDLIIYKFDIGNSYMTNNNGKGLYFALVNSNNDKISEIYETYGTKFIKKVSLLILETKYKKYRNEEKDL